jgi:linoleoyl-CoA desaturase
LASKAIAPKALRLLLFVGVLGVSHLADFVEHSVLDKDSKLNMSWPKLQMCASLDYNSNSTFFNWTLGGFNTHALHHLLPNICHVHYIDTVPMFKEISQKHDLTYMEMPYRKSLLSHFRFLKGMGSNQIRQLIGEALPHTCDS